MPREIDENKANVTITEIRESIGRAPKWHPGKPEQHERWIQWSAQVALLNRLIERIKGRDTASPKAARRLATAADLDQLGDS